MYILLYILVIVIIVMVYYNDFIAKKIYELQSEIDSLKNPTNVFDVFSSNKKIARYSEKTDDKMKKELEKYKSIHCNSKTNFIIPTSSAYVYFNNYKWLMKNDWLIHDLEDNRWFLPVGLIYIDSKSKWKWNDPKDLDVNYTIYYV